jgi:excinuclease ABC subunit B
MFKKKCSYIVEQIVRPTGIPDPQIEIRPTENQLNDLVEEIKKRKSKGEKALILTTTKRFAENVAEFLTEKGIRAKFLHSDLNTVERAKVIKELRKGNIDAIVGVNLLREGLDLPEVSLVAVLEADKEGFLRSFRSLIQIIGRAARHINGKAILYADRITPAIEKTVLETERRRKLQLEYNKKHGIQPKPVKKKVSNLLDFEIYHTIKDKFLEKFKTEEDILKEIAKLEKEMWNAANAWDFEKAAALRDKIKSLKELLGLV